MKTFVDANIQITPSTANNPVSTNHTLTGHVNVNAGEWSRVRECSGRHGDLVLADEFGWRVGCVCRAEQLYGRERAGLVLGRDQFVDDRDDDGEGDDDGCGRWCVVDAGDG